jgi:flagellar biogenesis protein FliO
MSMTTRLVIALGMAIALFCLWAWSMNRMDERRLERERQARRDRDSGLP